MPLVRIGTDIHYFAHVPKCGGSSVENYLSARFGSLALLNSRFLSVPERSRWTKSSPQHVTFDALQGLIPNDWIVSSFAVVRHPVKRLISAYHFQTEHEKTAPKHLSIDDWFEDWLEKSKESPFLYDNHVRPMSDIVPAGAATFRLEDGMTPLVAHLDHLAGNSEGPREILKENQRKTAAVLAVPSKTTLGKIATYYAEDFRRFGYTIDPDTPAKTMPARRSGGRSGIMARIASTFRMGSG